VSPSQYGVVRLRLHGLSVSVCILMVSTTFLNIKTEVGLHYKCGLILSARIIVGATVNLLKGGNYVYSIKSVGISSQSQEDCDPV
jgi:hypothetical protein